MIASGLRLAKYFLFYSLFALFAVIILLIAKGGDSSFFAGFILYVTGMISSCVSFIISIRTLVKRLYSSSERIPLFVVTAANILYLILFLFSALFALIIFSSFGHL
ncbi:MAG: hypothetical protein KBH06_12955 [Spirochaetes bacterium]|nr:hypothetical protein [Spirochaetota bacterium]HOU85689.1 hypothetical protein [Spirochaetota bacterium]